MLIEALTDAGSPPVNEDAFGNVMLEGGGIAWVIDGATSVSDRSLTGNPHGDVAWFALNVSEALTRFADPEAPPAEIIRAAIRHVAAAYQTRLQGQTPTAYERPIAAISWARVRSGDDGRLRIEAVRLGDCAVFLGEAGGVHALTGLQDISAERAANARIREQREAGARDDRALKAANLERLRRERAYLNQPGRRVLGLDETVADRLWSETRHASLGSALVLTTDGFYRGVEIYNQWTDETFVWACRIAGLSHVLARLRAEEADASTFDRFPRLKRRDDATAILLTT